MQVALKALRTEKAREVRHLRTVSMLLTHSPLPETRIGTAEVERTAPSKHPAIVWYIYFPSSPLEEFSWFDRDSYRYWATPLHGERTITDAEAQG